MTDKKLTDNEIIKALEGAILNAKKYDSKVWSIEVYKLENAIDLINRQQAEIERLQKEKDEYAYLYDKHINTAFSHIKSESYKEFAERLKERIYNGGVHPTVEDEFMCDIDNLLKEMVGENDDR